MTARFEALGTTVTVATVEPRELEAARAAVAHELAAFDAACSRFRADSELARVNAANGAEVHVGPVLRTAVRAALHGARMTGGLVDPTIGRTLRLAGYNETFAVVTARDASSFTPRFVSAPGWRGVELDEERGTLRVQRGIELDLGATGKALAADRAAAAAARVITGGVLVGIGGDIAVAGEPPAGGWPVRIAADHSTPLHVPGPTVSIAGGGLATSSTTVRRWQTRRGEVHHLFDPRTGRPADSRWRTVSVAAASCMHANVASTAAFLLDGDAVQWLSERALPARLDCIDGSTTYVASWPEDER